MPRRTIAIQVADPETPVVGFESGCPTRIFHRECERRRGCNLALRTPFYSAVVNERIKARGGIWDNGHGRERVRCWLLPNPTERMRCERLSAAFLALGQHGLDLWLAWEANGFGDAYLAVLNNAVREAEGTARPGVPVLGAQQPVPNHSHLRSMPAAGCECDHCRFLRQRRRDAGIAGVPAEADHSVSPVAWDGCLCRHCVARRPAALVAHPRLWYTTVTPAPRPAPAPVAPPVVNTSRCVCGACRGGVRFDGDDYVCDLCKAGAVMVAR